jgi:hypothetical protein
MAAVTASALELLPARRSLMLTFGEYCFHETWCEGLELLTQIIRVKTSLDETLLRCPAAATPRRKTRAHSFTFLAFCRK